MNRRNRHLEQLERESRELDRLGRVLRDEGLAEAGLHLDEELHQRLVHIRELEQQRDALSPNERLRDLLG